MNKSTENIKMLTKCAVVAALYAVATLVLFPISYGAIQFRVSEALCVLPFIFPQSAWGLFAGCIIANLLNPLGANILDIVFGSLATLVAAKIISKLKNRFLIPWVMAIANGLVIGAMIAYLTAPETFWASFALFGLQVATGELVVGYVVGLPILALLQRYREKIHI